MYKRTSLFYIKIKIMIKTLKNKDIQIPKSWAKNECLEPTPGSFSLKCWLDQNNTSLGDIPAFDNDVAAGLGGLVKGDIYQSTGETNELELAGVLMVKQ